MCVMCEAPLRARLIALATATYVDMNTHMRVVHRVAHAQHAHAPPVALPKVGRVKGRVHARAFGLPRVGLHALGDEAHVAHGHAQDGTIGRRLRQQTLCVCRDCRVPSELGENPFVDFCPGNVGKE